MSKFLKFVKPSKFKKNLIWQIIIDAFWVLEKFKQK